MNGYPFQSPPSSWRATSGQSLFRVNDKFQSTPSSRRATKEAKIMSLEEKFQSTPSTRRATRLTISFRVTISYFNPRPQRGGRPHTKRVSQWGTHFNPRPHHEERLNKKSRMRIYPSISIHALIVEGDLSSSFQRHPGNEISIHALIAEGDVPSDPTANEAIIFQSTPSMRRATVHDNGSGIDDAHFNPRPPCGERQVVEDLQRRWIKFQSAPSAWRATSINLRPETAMYDFNPRPPRGGRHMFRLL